MPEQEMSLEEVKKQCVFCHIIAGRVASKKIYEDDKVTAVLDINPANPGHVLLLPKEHYAIMPQIPDEDIAHLGMTSKAISAALLRAIKAQGTTIFIANGVVAGQRAQHVMAHIIPRMEGDSLGIELPERKISADKLNEIRNALLPSVKKLFGKSAEPSQEEPADNKENKKNEKKDSENSVKKKPAKEDADLDDIARLLGS